MKTESPRTFTSSKRFGGESSAHGKPNPFTAHSATASTTITSPTHGASSAFGLGSGAFASFGSASKTPKTPSGAASHENLPSHQTSNKESSGKDAPEAKPKSSGSAASTSQPPAPAPEHPLKSTWVVWYRPPTAKHLDYEKSTVALAAFGTAEAFWSVYAHLRRPSALPAVSDYHLFRKGVRPVWEDAANKRGGKWIVRLKKGVADRYWEDLLLAVVGDMFGDAGDEVCGAVLSVRQGEDVLSLWTRIDGGRNIKIRYVSPRAGLYCGRSFVTDLCDVGRRSSASSPFRPTPTSSGRVTTIALRSAPPSIRRGRRRRTARMRASAATR